MDYRESHVCPDHANSYHGEFERDPHRRMVWQLEKSILDKILIAFYGNAEINHLDFACGTGRILSYLEGRAKSSVGVDLSTAMLEVARRHNKTAEIIEADLTRVDVLRNRKFNLITAFRFFPNAQPELRRDAMRVIVEHLHEDGYVVFNNHKNTASTIHRLVRLIGRGVNKGMSIAEVEALVEEHNLEIEKIFHLCVFPASGKHMVLPQASLVKIERFLSRISFLRNLGENLMFVCKHKKSKQS